MDPLALDDDDVFVFDDLLGIRLPICGRLPFRLGESDGRAA